MRCVGELHFLAAGEHLVTAVVLVPLCNGCVLVHMLDDVAPSDPRVISTERDLALLRAVGDDAHLCAAEIVVEEVLEPHPRDEQEVPRVLATLLDILDRAVRTDLPVILARQPERLVELLQDAAERQRFRCAVGVVVLQKGQAHHDVREPLAAVRIRDVLHVLDQTRDVKELRHGGHLLRLFVDHYGRADATVRMTAAAHLSPFVLGAVDNVCKIRERSH